MEFDCFNQLKNSSKLKKETISKLQQNLSFIHKLIKNYLEDSTKKMININLPYRVTPSTPITKTRPALFKKYSLYKKITNSINPIKFSPFGDEDKKTQTDRSALKLGNISISEFSIHYF